MTLESKLADLLGIWFPDDLDNPAEVGARAADWFGGATSFDELLHERFADLPDRAAEASDASVPLSDVETVSLVLALDQLPRNLYRGSSRSFRYDPIALEVASRLVRERADEQLHPVMAAFVYLPFEHAEDRTCQEQAVAGFRRLLERVSPPLKDQFANFLQYAEQHFVVIDEFGRFPHRNRILDRTPTAEETAYLESGGATFG